MAMTPDLLRSPRLRWWKYAPIRFWLLRSDEQWARAVDEFDDAVEEDRSNALVGPTERLYFAHQERGLPALRENEVELFPEERMRNALVPEGDETIGHPPETQMKTWAANGQQLFDVSPISAMFLNSDASSVPLESVRFRFESFYLHWGAHLQLPSPAPEQFIDGCFVELIDWRKLITKAGESAERPHALQLTFTSTLPESYQWHASSLLANMCMEAEGTFPAFLDLAEDTTFGDILRDVVDDSFYGTALAARWRAGLPAAVSMAANCLCYLCSEDVDIVTTYGEHEPPRMLLVQARSDLEKERRRAVNKLDALGFRLIHLCGEDLAKRNQFAHGSREIPPHWRSGHWRHVRHGPRWSMVKLNWIAGTVVNKDKGDPATGHVYVP